MKLLFRIISLLVLLVGVYLFVIGETGWGVIAVIVALILYPTKATGAKARNHSRAVSSSHTHYGYDDDDRDDNDDNDNDNDGGDSSDSGDSGGGSDD
ncbi:hypothetical protein HHO41_00420 [Bacillus sp. DNRA2]|uniref:hypothetical protein n=1 Tax=Bacillus sp. DNRA2 TaxID=2723053 RepID=UPI00145E9719|nr:hypothetical protein [Bacillus sp. DNRA2]NMD68732.1 hypothetical protein [Bacillus sp. DNRA2]